MATFSAVRAVNTSRQRTSKQLFLYLKNSEHALLSCNQVKHNKRRFFSVLSCSTPFTKTWRTPSQPKPNVMMHSRSFVMCTGRTQQTHIMAKYNNPNSDNSRTYADEKSGDNKESKDKSEEPKKESRFTGKNAWKLGLIFLGGASITWGFGLISIWGAPQLDPEGQEIQDEYSDMPAALAYMRRTWKEMNIFKEKIQEPSREKLLPDPLTYPYMQPPYTLVLEMTGVLIHPDWTYSTGWRFKKRPGIEYFLSQVGPPLFEVVIYSSESGLTADPLVNHLDPQGYIMYRLYRDTTRYMEGHHVKDLSCLNRDLSRVIIIDCNEDSISLQPENAFVLKKWNGEDGDRTLIELAHFLRTVGASNVEDIRPVLDYYKKFDDPLAAFRENQRKLQEEEEARAKAAADTNQKKGWLSGLGKR